MPNGIFCPVEQAAENIRHIIPGIIFTNNDILFISLTYIFIEFIPYMDPENWTIDSLLSIKIKGAYENKKNTSG